VEEAAGEGVDVEGDRDITVQGVEGSEEGGGRVGGGGVKRENSGLSEASVISLGSMASSTGAFTGLCKGRKEGGLRTTAAGDNLDMGTKDFDGGGERECAGESVGERALAKDRHCECASERGGGRARESKGERQQALVRRSEREQEEARGSERGSERQGAGERGSEREHEREGERDSKRE